MQNNIPQLISFLLHAGIAGLTFIYQPPIQPVNVGDGMLVELREGPTPQGTTVIPIVEKIKIPPKVIEKIDTPIIHAPKKEVNDSTQKKSAKVITQTQESPIKAAPETPEIVASNLSAEPMEDFGREDGIRDALQLQQKKGNQPPSYPTLDRLNNREGKVVVLGYVNEQGHVQKIKLESSSGTRKMNYNALKAFSLYRFEKGQQGWVRMPFQYILKGPSQRIGNSRRRTDGRVVR